MKWELNRGFGAFLHNPDFHRFSGERKQLTKHMVFCYGTLKRNENNHKLLEGAVFRGEHLTVEGYVLYDNGSFPFMVREKTDVGVSGELWEVDDLTLRKLDILEGVHWGLYSRERVRLNDGSEAWAYVYDGDLKSLVKCGSFWKRVKHDD